MFSSRTLLSYPSSATAHTRHNSGSGRIGRSSDNSWITDSGSGDLDSSRLINRSSSGSSRQLGRKGKGRGGIEGIEGGIALPLLREVGDALR